MRFLLSTLVFRVFATPDFLTLKPLLVSLATKLAVLLSCLPSQMAATTCCQVGTTVLTHRQSNV
jgi:hypothetical protein